MHSLALFVAVLVAAPTATPPVPIADRKPMVATEQPPGASAGSPTPAPPSPLAVDAGPLADPSPPPDAAEVPTAGGTDDDWGDEDRVQAAASDTARPPRGTAGALVVGWQPPPPPDPALVERNRRLTEQMHRGERWMIGGRIGNGLSAIPAVAGLVLLATYGAQKAALDADDPASPTPNPRHPAVGGVLLGIGIAGGVASTTVSILGSLRVAKANRGELGLVAGSRHGGLRYSGRF